MTVPILNNHLKWDGTHLGSFPKEIIMIQWKLETTNYFKLNLSTGILYCNWIRTNSIFPCIVEDIKLIFNIPRRGIHRICIGGFEYIIYYVPISPRGEIIWETPLHHLNAKHPLRKDIRFRKLVQQTITFCEILALSQTGEAAIRIRPDASGNLEPINFNETTTELLKERYTGFSIVSKTLFMKWFSEDTSVGNVVREIIRFDDQNVWKDYYDECASEKITIETHIGSICAAIRKQVEDIIRNYDSAYIWYSYFIIERLSKYLLSSDNYS